MEIESARVFVKVVELGSFSRAAEALQLPKSTISRMVSRLESNAGAKLLVRTTRSLKLTEIGRTFYEKCLSPIRQLEEARRNLQDSDGVLAGTVRLTAPEDLGNHVVSRLLGELIHKHPRLHFDFHYSDDVVDLVQGGFDLAVRLGKLSTASFKFKRLGEITLIPVASPEYLQKKAKIRSPHDLEQHEALIYQHSGLTKWQLRSRKESMTIALRARVSGNQMVSLLSLAEAGAGLAILPHYLCSEKIQNGTLVRILPDWRGPVYPVSLVSPVGLSSSLRVKTVSDYLLSEIQTVLAGKSK